MRSTYRTAGETHTIYKEKQPRPLFLNMNGGGGQSSLLLLDNKTEAVKRKKRISHEAGCPKQEKLKRTLCFKSAD